MGVGVGVGGGGGGWGWGGDSVLSRHSSVIARGNPTSVLLRALKLYFVPFWIILSLVIVCSLSSYFVHFRSFPFSSVLFRSFPFSSVLFRSRPFSSVLVRYRPLSSVIVRSRPGPFSSVFVRFRPFSSVLSRSLPFFSVLVRSLSLFSLLYYYVIFPAITHVVLLYLYLPNFSRYLLCSLHVKCISIDDTSRNLKLSVYNLQ